jgi:hypothetical protein
MRSKRLLISALVLFPVAASAMSLNPRAIARFDHSYAKCEAKFPEMRGARDEAYLSMYRVKADAKARAELAAVRKGAPYQNESKRVRDEDAKSPPAPQTIDAQCRALWGETQRVRSLAQ